MSSILRESLIIQAEAAFLEVSKQIDALFDLCAFFNQRYADDSPSMRLKLTDLASAVSTISSLLKVLSEVIIGLKLAQPRRLSRPTVEIDVLNELQVNVNALVYFLTSHDISLDSFDAARSVSAFHLLIRANRLLT